MLRKGKKRSKQFWFQFICLSRNQGFISGGKSSWIIIHISRLSFYHLLDQTWQTSFWHIAKNIISDHELKIMFSPEANFIIPQDLCLQILREYHFYLKKKPITIYNYDMPPWKISYRKSSTCFWNRPYRHKLDSAKHLDGRKKNLFFQPLSDLDLPQRQLKATLRKEDGDKMGSKTRPTVILEVLFCKNLELIKKQN